MTETPLIHVENVSKSYGKVQALRSVSLDIPPGKIVGLVGPNGSGKTTLLRALTGGIDYTGNIRVHGVDPRTQRARLMERTAVIHDVSTLPPWMKVREVLDFVQGVHPNFHRDQCEAYLGETDVRLNRKVKQLSKGMKTQLHLAVLLATTTDLMILDEPTHGLDILFRKRLYSSIITDYFDEQKSLLISTHQVEEVEHILSDVIFIRKGEVLLYATMDQLRTEFHQVVVSTGNAADLDKLDALTVEEFFGKKIYLFRGVDRAQLEALGELQVPSVADIFIALMGGAK